MVYPDHICILSPVDAWCEAHGWTRLVRAATLLEIIGKPPAPPVPDVPLF
jgi:hypothetical protein